MAYEKPKLIDLSKNPKKGFGQEHSCISGSGAGGWCKNGSAAGGFCEGGSGGRPFNTPEP